MEDVDLLYEWRNETECRKNSINTSYIEYGDHCRWFAGELNSDTCNIFICMKEQMYGEGCDPVGQVRIDYGKDRTGEISYSIGAEYRCNGYGTRILKMLEESKNTRENADRLCAVVKSGNTASQKCFEKLGYVKSIKADMVYYSKDL
jgi:RimJ/RimL family protein N-acetyltransferase